MKNNGMKNLNRKFIIALALLTGSVYAMEKGLLNVNAKNKRGRTPLGEAAKRGEIKTAKALLKAGADVNEQNKAGEAALHRASVYGQTAMVQLLLENGADPTLQTSAGWTPYRLATYSDKVRQLILSHITMVTPAEVKHIIPGVMAIRKEVGKDPSAIIFSQLVQSIVNEKLQTAKKAAPGVPEKELREKIEQSIRQALKKQGAL